MSPDRKEFCVSFPSLVVVPANMLEVWEGELRFWAGAELDVVSYCGSSAARAVIHDYELWMHPDSNDSKARRSRRGQGALDCRVRRHPTWGQIGRDNGEIDCKPHRKPIKPCIVPIRLSITSLSCTACKFLERDIPPRDIVLITPQSPSLVQDSHRPACLLFSWLLRFLRWGSWSQLE